MKIGIVEDEAIWREKIQKAVAAYCREKGISCEISSYSNGRDFMKSAEADLLFLDIELAEGEDGFAIAEKLMDSGNPCKTCFLTSHTELARQGYRVNAFRYIDKKHLGEIKEALDVFFQTKIQDRMICCNDISGMARRINLGELLLIETNGRKLRYLLWDGREYLCEGLISEAARSLSQYGFCHIQRSYIVNLKYIEEVNSREVTLCHGIKVVIGRARSKEFKKEFFQWRMRFEN